MLPCLVIINDFAIARYVLDKIHTFWLMIVGNWHSQHLSILEFRCIPHNIVIYINDFHAREAGPETAQRIKLECFESSIID
jgi:hypothetical protein